MIIVGFLIGGLLLILNLWPLISYLYTPDIRVVYGIGYYLVYMFAPLFLVQLLILAKSHWPSHQTRRIYLALVVLNLVSEVVIVTFLNSDANKIAININNMSNAPVTELHIEGRNNQNINLNMIEPGEVRRIYCDCRDVVFPQDAGVRLSFNLADLKFSSYLIGKHSPEYDQELEVRILNDSSIFRSYEYPEDTLWGKMSDSDNGLRTWAEWQQHN